MTEVLSRLAGGHDLSRAEAQELFGRIARGHVGAELLGNILTALAAKGETAEEIAGAAAAMRGSAVAVRCPAGAIDTCGTGGDGISTFNVSTAAAIIAAAAGAVVAKHGNRTNTRASGSADVLAVLGVNIEAEVAVVERCLAEAGIGFLFAPKLHPAMRHAGAVRQRLGTQTIFNYLGPLINPAGVRRQVVGVSRPGLTETFSRVLIGLNAEHAWVVHGSDGLCDLTITGPSAVCEVKDGQARAFHVRPQDAGLKTASLDALRVDSPQSSAEVIRGVLDGRAGPPRDHALLNAAAALVVAGAVEDLAAGVDAAARAVDDGRARGKLDELVRCSNERA